MDADTRYEELEAALRKLGQYEDELWEIHRGLLRYQDAVNQYWIASEAEGIRDLISRQLGQVRRSMDELGGVRRDLVRVYKELPEEQGV